jgi:hypothetical protein
VRHVLGSHAPTPPCMPAAQPERQALACSNTCLQTWLYRAGSESNQTEDQDPKVNIAAERRRVERRVEWQAGTEEPWQSKTGLCNTSGSAELAAYPLLVVVSRLLECAHSTGLTAYRAAVLVKVLLLLSVASCRAACSHAPWSKGRGPAAGQEPCGI